MRADSLDMIFLIAIKSDHSLIHSSWNSRPLDSRSFSKRLYLSAIESIIAAFSIHIYSTFTTDPRTS